MNEQRYIDIETKIAHQEVIIESLNETVREHQQTIDMLVNDFKKLAKRIDSAKDNTPDIGPGDEKPPHY